MAHANVTLNEGTSLTIGKVTFKRGASHAVTDSGLIDACRRNGRMTVHMVETAPKRAAKAPPPPPPPRVKARAKPKPKAKAETEEG